MRQAPQVLVFIVAFASAVSVLLVSSAFTPVALAGNPITFTATPNADLSGAPGVHLVWTVGDEIETAGYSLYRSERREGPYTQLNRQLLPVSSEVIVGGQHIYEDATVKPGQVYYYQLEVVNLEGQATPHGPVVVTASSTAQTGEQSIPSLALGLLAVLGGGALAGLWHTAPVRNPVDRSVLIPIAGHAPRMTRKAAVRIDLAGGKGIAKAVAQMRRRAG